MALQNDFIDEIRQKANIVEVVSEYVKLDLRGTRHLGLCPFHQEKTPSFNVDAEKQLYYCFGCGAGGDVFNFMMEIENVSFVEAAKALAERYRIPIPDRPITKQRRKVNELRDQLFAIHELGARFYQHLLLKHPSGKAALIYFEKRGFTRATIEKFRLGYAPQSWTALFHFLKKKGYTDYQLEKSGLVLPKKTVGHYDRFRDRAMFTIFNLRGQPIGFGGRVMEDGKKPKYLNSPETILFEKNQNLYGLHLAKNEIRQSQKAIIVEGYTDVITAHQYGIENVIASLGTALTENQAHLLARYADEVYIAYDADTAGQSATLRGLDILRKANLMVKVIKLPNGKDPDELIREDVEAFRNLFNRGISLVDFKLDQIVKKYDLEDPNGKVKAVEELLSLFLSIDNAVEKDDLIIRISQRVQVSRQALEEELEQFIKSKSKIKDNNNKKWDTRKEKVDIIKNPINLFETKFISAIFQKPDMIGKIFSEITPEVFRDKRCRAIAEKIYIYFQELNGTKELTTSDLLEKFSDENQREILKLVFRYQIVDAAENYLKEGLKKLKGYQKVMEMETIIKEIKQIKSQGDLKSLNQVLIRYHQKFHQSGKGGY